MHDGIWTRERTFVGERYLPDSDNHSDVTVLWAKGLGKLFLNNFLVNLNDLKMQSQTNYTCEHTH